jgi:hypothetical protein
VPHAPSTASSYASFTIPSETAFTRSLRTPMAHSV